ncbi:MAG: hypothetical protein QXP53_00975 [Candidatus Pacearchaeota archaeon]
MDEQNNEIEKGENAEERENLEKGQEKLPGTEKKVLKSKNITLIILLLVIAAVIVFFVFKDDITSFVVKNNFNYNGLEFFKTTLYKETFFATKVNLTVKNVKNTHIFYFRNDPRKLDRIPFSVNRKIATKTYVSFTKESLQCETVNLVAWNLGDFLGRMGSKVTGAVADPESSENGTKLVVNCSSNKKEIIVLKAQASQTRVYQDANNEGCIIIEAKDCSIIEASERFILGMLVKKINEEKVE